MPRNLQRRLFRPAGFRPRIHLLGPDPRGVGQSLGALSVLAVTSVVAGVVLGRSLDRLAELPGLLLLVPAAIALRGNIFGALGSRLGTAIHTGTFRLSLRTSSVVGQNVWASMVLTLALSLGLALLASAVAPGVGVEGAISVADYVVVSVVGGTLASVFVLLVALGMATGSVRWGLDPDNVTAPMVTAAGDVLTLPALILASHLVRRDVVTPVVAGVVAAVTVISLVAATRSKARDLRTILRESIPVLVLAGFLSLMAGVTMENRFEVFADQPVLLVLVPGYLAMGGALGGILANRLSSKLHLGLIDPSVVPRRGARADLGMTFGLAVPVFAIVALVSQGAGVLTDLAGPGAGRLVGIAVTGGAMAVVAVVVMAYYGTIAAVRFGVDPDTVGIPIVSAVLDLVGAFTLIFAITWLGGS